VPNMPLLSKRAEPTNFLKGCVKKSFKKKNFKKTS
jgi:hypothetical protein